MAGSSRSIDKALGSAKKAVSISATTAQPETKAVYIGVAGDYYFEINGTEVVFKSTTAGSVIPINVTKVATTTSFADAVSAGDVLFLY